MAHSDTEIEIKIQLKESEFFKARERIKKIARFMKSTQHADEYFTPMHRNFLEPEFPFEWLSIRRRSGKTIMNYKHFYPENAEAHTHCDEFEVEISSPEQLEKIFSMLNLKKLVIVLKDRETYKYGDEFEISLDIVKDLGYFIEIEAMKDFGSIESARKAISDFAKSLGIDASKPDERGYPYLLMEIKGLVKNQAK
jgi:predicted adenylyl cyclase CyaB